MRSILIVKALIKKSGLQRAGNNLSGRLLFAVLSLLLIGGTLMYHVDQGARLFAVHVEGEEIGLLAQSDDLQEILNSLQREALLHFGQPVYLAEEVTYTKVYRPMAKAEPDKVSSQLRNILSYKVDAMMLTVEGKDFLPVADTAAVEKIMELIAAAFIPVKKNVSLERVQPVEQIGTRYYRAYPEDLRDPKMIAAILLRGTHRREIHLVSRGDSLWQIAHDHDLSVEDLRKANPQLEGDVLQIGDELSLIVAEPMVNVITVERLEVMEQIPYQTKYVNDSDMWSGQTKVLEEGIYGSRVVIFEVTRENGREVSREIVSSGVTREPVAETVARGTASIPSRGTGSFLWPVRGGGRLTSPFGWRWGSFHAGIDIAAPVGTPILAADSGVVVFEGWDGGYGKCIVIDHGTHYTRYAHNSQNLVRMGEAVNKGEVIGRIGNTGRSFGPHVHFEIRTGGMYGPPQDPLRFYRP